MLVSFQSALTVLSSLVVLGQSLPQGPGGGQFGTGGGQYGATTTAVAAATVPGSVTATASAIAAAAEGGSTGSTCNNSADLCNRKYNNVTHMGAHDSAFIRDGTTGNSIAGNQYFNATIALSAGIRLLQAQVHNLNGTLHLCHTSCSILNAGTLTDWLSKIKFWMDHNPNEVVTLLLVNSDNLDVSSFGSSFETSGLATYGYAPSTIGATSNWPTLQQMITANKRLVTFVASITYSASYPYLLNEFTHIFENPYEVTNPANFTCALDRPSTAGSASAAISGNMMPLLNHFLDTVITSGVEIPDVSDIDNTNSASITASGALGLHAQLCKSMWGVKPVFILVDFYDHGPAIATADSLNGITVGGRDTSGTSSGSTSNSAVKNTLRLATGALVTFLTTAVLLI